MAKLRPGDVIQAKSGLQRVVRQFTPHPKDGKLLFITVTIAHCSWTHDGFTLLDCDQLTRGGYRKVGRSRMRSAADKKVNAVVAAQERFWDERMGRAPRRPGPRRTHFPKLTCCEVRGIA